jgi:CRISPR associated protein Cas1
MRQEWDYQQWNKFGSHAGQPGNRDGVQLNIEFPVAGPGRTKLSYPNIGSNMFSRISPLTRSPRLAATPVNACLNLLYCLCEAEARLAAVALGLDPGIGFLHVDTPNRDSLTCDLMEVVRPSVDAFVLNWIQTEPLRKSDFWEDRNGKCRIASRLAIKLWKPRTLGRPHSWRLPPASEALAGAGGKVGRV